MKKSLLAACTALAFTLPASAQIGTEPPPPPPAEAPSPNEIVAAAAPDEWKQIAAEDLLVMTLAPAAGGSQREVVIQLMPAPFAQGWVENIRTLARANWYDGISVNRVQDNYVVQWGDPGYDNPESGEAETKPLPDGLNVMGEAEYVIRPGFRLDEFKAVAGDPIGKDSYAEESYFARGFPFASSLDAEAKNGMQYRRGWPVHCYGMVGVGRNYSPDTGSGAELYTVIGHAPRHLDRNIALVGRIISGIEHLSSLPRGTGALGFYTEGEADKRTPILSVRVAADLPEEDQPQFEYLTTGGTTFAKYAEARANRRDPFFIVPAGGADICNIPVPIRTVQDD